MSDNSLSLNEDESIRRYESYMTKNVNSKKSFDHAKHIPLYRKYTKFI